MEVQETAMSAEQLAIRLDDLRRRLDASRFTNIGFPSTLDIDYRELWPFFSTVLNNVGDPYRPGSVFPAHCKDFEREVVEMTAGLLRAPADDRWGYVTTGGSEGTEYGLLLARTIYPDGVVYHSAAAHFSVAKAAAKLRIPAVVVKAGEDGEMDYADLRDVVSQHRDRPAIVVASVGTTMTEALDDIGIIRQTLAEVPVHRSLVHVDAALSGIPLALLPPQERPRFDFTAGADSISVSGHKFLGSPFPCGVVVTRQTLRARIGSPVDYLNTVDATIGGSRSGHASLILWYALHALGRDGLQQRAEESRSLAWYTVSELTHVGWPAWRHRHALTVVLDTPPDEVLQRWPLATSGGISHLVCMPGITRDQIDAFVASIAETVGRPATPAAQSTHPRQGSAIRRLVPSPSQSRAAQPGDQAAAAEHEQRSGGTTAALTPRRRRRAGIAEPGDTSTTPSGSAVTPNGIMSPGMWS